MKQRVLLCALLAVCLTARLGAAAAQGQPAAHPKAEWTVLVYMNGDNNLEKFAVFDFLEMAKVGSTDKVNVVVQFDRRTKEIFAGISPGWDETLRFLVKKQMWPLPANALPSSEPKELDMGDGKVLRRFVEWGRQAFPANKYALIIWDHGDGFRALEPEDGVADGGEPRRFQRSLGETSYRAVSHDETNGNMLFNRDIQDNLTDLLGNDRLAVLGFDACLMSMVEVGYAMRNVSQVLVASEDLEPATGWNYEDWLKELVAAPESFGPEELGRLLVRSYRRVYSGEVVATQNFETTQSAVRLAKMDELATALDRLSDLLVQNLGTEVGAIRKARGSCAAYAPCQKCKGQQLCYLNVDLGRFLDELILQSHNPCVLAAARKARGVLSEAVLDSYAGSERAGAWGSAGLAVYFPQDGDTYGKDTSRKFAYQKGNPIAPVEFVESRRWPIFLHAYFAQLKQSGLKGGSAESGHSCPMNGGL
jgi:hypothetical protein